MSDEKHDEAFGYSSPQVPGSWSVVEFDEAFKSVSTNGRKLKTSEYLKEGKFPVVDQGDGLIAGYSDDDSLTVQVGGGLIGFGDHTRRFKLLNFDFVPGADGLKVLRPTLLDVNYAFYLCQSLKFPDKGYSRHFSFLSKCTVPVAPENEQKRIVAKIDELFSQIDEGERNLKRVQALLKQYRQSVLKAAVTGELTKDWRAKNADEGETGADLLKRILVARRDAWEVAELAKLKAKGKVPKNDDWKMKYVEPLAPDTSNLPKLPQGWVWARAEQVCEFITKGTTPDAAEMSAGEGEVPYIKVYNLTVNGTLDFTINPTFVTRKCHESFLARSVIYPGDVLMNIVGPPLGKVSIAPCNFPEWNANQALAIFRSIDGLKREFLANYLLSAAALDWMSSRAKATSGQLNLTLEICRNLPVPLPNEEEQDAVVARTAEVLSAAAAGEDEVVTVRKVAIALRQSVLRSAFAGNLVPQNESDESAFELLTLITRTDATDTGDQGAASPSRGRRHKNKESVTA